MRLLFTAMLLILSSCATPVLMMPNANIAVPEKQGDVSLGLGSGSLALNGQVTAALSDDYYFGLDFAWSEWDSVKQSYPHHFQNYFGITINRVDRKNSFYIANGIGYGSGRIELFDYLYEIDEENDHAYQLHYEWLYYNLVLGRETRILNFGFALRSGYIRLYDFTWPQASSRVQLEGLMINPNGFLTFPAGPAEFFAQLGLTLPYAQHFIPTTLLDVAAGVQFHLNLRDISH